MAGGAVIRMERRKRLFQLLRLKKVYQACDSKVIDGMIMETEMEMAEADVDWVKKKAAELA